MPASTLITAFHGQGTGRSGDLPRGPQGTRVCAPPPKTTPQCTRPTQSSPRQIINEVSVAAFGWVTFTIQNICHIAESAFRKQVSESTQPLRRGCIRYPSYRMLKCIMANHTISYNAFVYSTMVSPLHLGCEYLIAHALNFPIQGG